MLTFRDCVLKRTTDLIGAVVGLCALGWLIVIAAAIARLETGKSGLFRHERVGLGGKRFEVLKIRTMRERDGSHTCVTVQGDERITYFGRTFRRLKIDELPQLINVLRGEMSLVGPRPDVPELAGHLLAIAPAVVSVRPGITGPASLKYRYEEQLLAGRADSEWINSAVIFPDKTRINESYVRNYHWLNDWQYLWQTVFGGGDYCNYDDLSEMISLVRCTAKNAA